MLPFDITARLANAFDFAIANPAAIDAGARHLERGYRLRALSKRLLAASGNLPA